MSFLTNPFPNDPDRGAIWTMLVERDVVSRRPSPTTEAGGSNLRDF
jgi:hypothetical protein